MFNDTSTYDSNFTKAEFICIIHSHCYHSPNGNDVGHKKGNSLSAHVQSLSLWHSLARWQWHSPSWQYDIWSPWHMVEAHSLALEHDLTKGEAGNKKKIKIKTPLMIINISKLTENSNWLLLWAVWIKGNFWLLHRY